MRPTTIESRGPRCDNETLRRIAKIIYAETNASSLRAVEALASMIGNLCEKSSRPLAEIARDESVFESLGKNSPRHSELLADDGDPKFQMCLRAAKRMSAGRLPDTARGATRFHRAENSPDWASGIGYIAEVDGLLFYRNRT